MGRRFAITFTLIAALTAPGSIFAKGRTVKITITGSDLPTPIEFNEETVGQFHIWAGPGVTINGVPQKEGFIIDWPKGVVAERRRGLPRYEVSFYKGCRMSEAGCRTRTPLLAYVVAYEYDFATEEGYVYLPGRADQWYQVNTSSIYRGGLEGNWFLATNAWNKFVKRLIKRAAAEKALSP